LTFSRALGFLRTSSYHTFGSFLFCSLSFHISVEPMRAQHAQSDERLAMSQQLPCCVFARYVSSHCQLTTDISAPSPFHLRPLQLLYFLVVMSDLWHLELSSLSGVRWVKKEGECSKSWQDQNQHTCAKVESCTKTSCSFFATFVRSLCFQELLMPCGKMSSRSVWISCRR